ncbi:hypothetical protein BCR34DRAFT_601667 [Clohesyomyces aquaticus]|uniref:Aspartic peptidase domain-containing protein n=1 Tax=Clohesyomyces aquaticus TaxID=1231657 RepID=A0A1Y1ZLG3_9PLEO|nr:hypothetical protein BCR34DRAFT_601667 [Clohesyomyces aquaticus]
MYSLVNNQRCAARSIIRLVLSSIALAVSCHAKCSAQPPLMLYLSNCTDTQPGVDSWGALLRIGTQNFCVMPSTFTPHTYLMGEDICKDDAANHSINAAQCISRRGGTFNIDSAKSQSIYVAASENDLRPDTNWQEIQADSKKPFGEPGFTTLAVPIGPVQDLTHVLVSAITDGQNHNLPHLGIASANATFLSALKNAGYPADGWGLNAGSTTKENARAGNIVFGGYDEASIRGPWTSYPINFDGQEGGANGSVGGRYCPLEVEVQSMDLRMRNGSTVSLVEASNGGLKACIEPYDTLFRLSSSQSLSLFRSTTGYATDSLPDPSYFVVEPGLIKTPPPSGFSLVITLGSGPNTFTTTIPNSELEQPRTVIDTEGRRVTQANVTESRVFEKTVLNRIVLGKAFLSQVYLRVRFEEKRFELAQIVTDPVTPRPVEFDCVVKDLGGTVGGLKKGLIALGVVVGVLLVVVVGMLIFVKRFARGYARRILRKKRGSVGAPDMDGGLREGNG